MFICQFCSKESYTKHSHIAHQAACPSNPNRNNPYNRKFTKKRKGGNQWTKAKESGEVYVISEATRQKFKVSSTGRKHSEQTKDKIRQSRIKFLEANPEMVPYKLNHYSNGPSYPEIYWKGVLDSNDITYTEQYRIGMYAIDFAIVDGKIALEIDGDQHYLDPRIVESDIRRTNKLQELGWKVVRVKWSDYQKLDHIQRKLFVDNILNCIRDTNSTG